MPAPWLHIVGIGEDGMAGLTPATRAVVQAAQVIIDSGANIHHRNYDDCTALMLAAENNATDVMQLLIDHGAQLEATNRCKETAL